MSVQAGFCHLCNTIGGHVNSCELFTAPQRGWNFAAGPDQSKAMPLNRVT